MSRAPLAGFVIIAVAVAAALVWWLRTPADARVSAPPTQASYAGTGADLPAAATVPAAQSPPTESPPPEESLEQRFRESDDLLAFIEAIRPAARAGDGASAWWIYRALQRCDTEYKIHFHRRGRVLTLDEALQTNAGNAFLPMEETRKLHAQCNRLLATDPDILGAWIYWVAAAANRGVPQASMEMAHHMLKLDRISGTDANRVKVRDLALQALRSKDPAVMAVMGDLVSLSSGVDGSLASFDWLLAACQRGLDCTTHSEHAQQWCRSDPGCQPFEDLEAILRRTEPANFDEIERRAREINRLMDEDRFEELVQPLQSNK